MSLPIPSTNAASYSAAYNNLDPKQLQALEGPLIALTQTCGGDLRRLMFAFFSFLHRRTDFYLVPHPDDTENKMGFREGDAEKLLLAAFRQFPLRRIPQKSAPAKKAAAAAVPTSSSTTTTTTTTNEPVKIKKEEPPAADDEKLTTTSKPTPTAAIKKKTTDKEEIGNMAGVEYNEEGTLQIPVGNGGSTKRYKWTQTLDECSVLIGIPDGLRGKDLDVKLTVSSLSVKSKKALANEDCPLTFLEGSLVERIRLDESTWSVEGGVVIVTLDKVQKGFWATVLKGDDKIDTELVDNRRHISDYDDITQGQIRKVLFDQNQYHKGLPSSDELQGKKSEIPTLPSGVEYIDRHKLDEEDKKKKANFGK
jgi:hypothetical protein